LKSTSCRDLAREVLEQCLADVPPKEMPRALLQDMCGQALFGILIEGLADRFDRRLCDTYTRLFSQALAHEFVGTDPSALVARYDRVRRTRPISGKPNRIMVLSRVTLGADVAVTSVLMAAAKRRFPHAEIVFVGPRKNFELFAGDSRLHHAEVNYRRGGLRERLGVTEELKALMLAAPDYVVIDPDSRLTQLGLLPVCPEDRYHLFESRAYGGEDDRPVSELAATWAAETIGVTGVKPYIALGAAPRRGEYIAASLGVGDNPAKRVPDPFEEELLKLLAATGRKLLIDKGAGGEEAERVEGAVRRAGIEPITWEGSFAGFASIIAGARLYVGYDSAGQHVAAACGIPQIDIFAGFPCPRMFARWRPAGEHSHAIRVERPDPEEILARVRETLSKLEV
jgi:ADP-heptose:LPS heptosyltransferase